MNKRKRADSISSTNNHSEIIYFKNLKKSEDRNPFWLYFLKSTSEARFLKVKCTLYDCLLPNTNGNTTKICGHLNNVHNI